jgi:hypothetical protein
MIPKKLSTMLSGASAIRAGARRDRRPHPPVPAVLEAPHAACQYRAALASAGNVFFTPDCTFRAAR